MNLVLIGGNSVAKLKEIITSAFDNIEISSFSSVSEFVEYTNMRSLEVDRLFLLEDSLNPYEDNSELFVSFNMYLSQHYPMVRFIFIGRTDQVAEQASQVFMSTYMLTVCLPKMSSVVILNMVQNQINDLKRLYAYQPKDSPTSGVLEETVEKPKTEKGSKRNQTKPNTQSKKKGGLFGLGIFGKKGKNNATTVTPVVQTEAQETENVNNQQSGVVEDDFEEPHETTNHTGQSIDEETTNNEEPADNFRIVDMDGAQGLGIGRPLTQEDVFGSDSDLEGFEDLGENETNNQEYDTYKHTTSSHTPDNSVEDDEEDSEYLPFGEEPQSVNGFETDNSSEREFNIYEEDVEQPTPAHVDLDIQDKVRKLEQLKNDALQDGLSVNIPKTGEQRVQPHASVSLDQVEDHDSLPFDLAGLQKDFDDTKVKVVEKIVEVERIVEVSKPNQAQQRTYKNGVRLIIVTGDRKTGITRTAMSMASHYAKTSRTLFVDYDIQRKGSLMYIGLEKIANQEPNVQQGLALLRNTRILENVTYPFVKGGFDCLLTVHGTEFDDKILSDAERVLATQRIYKTIIIDCPLENLHLLDEIILYSEILICVESTKSCALNTVVGLANVTEDEKFLGFLFNNAQFFLAKEDNVSQFKSNMSYIADLFSLEEANIDWSDVPVVGSVSNFSRLLASF